MTPFVLRTPLPARITPSQAFTNSFISFNSRLQCGIVSQGRQETCELLNKAKISSSSESVIESNSRSQFCRGAIRTLAWFQEQGV